MAGFKEKSVSGRTITTLHMIKSMDLAALTSGGKDSVYAIYFAEKMGYNVKYLLSMVPERSDSYMFHHPNIGLTSVQAKLMGLPLLVEKTVGEKEKELADLKRLISRIADSVDGILSGALASNYQKKRITRICNGFGLECVSPLWHIDPEKYWSDLLDAGFKVMVVSVSAEGLNKNWLGRIMDASAVAELKEVRKNFLIHLGFEGGEAETLVLDCPMFRKKIKVVEAKTLWDGVRGTYDVSKIKEVSK